MHAVREFLYVSIYSSLLYQQFLFFPSYLGFTFFQDYFSHFEMSQYGRWVTGDARSTTPITGKEKT